MTATENLKVIGEDKRVHKFVLPARIVMTSGKVTGAEKLLVGKKLQIGLREPDVTVLDNRGEENTPLSSLISGRNCTAAYGFSLPAPKEAETFT